MKKLRMLAIALIMMMGFMACEEETGIVPTDEPMESSEPGGTDEEEDGGQKTE